ncbi:hypothetical protein V9L05_16325 [Bernardetia sp. Wsw4-3y2]|uniref:hypothetical protein n=1 Tax=unclassified Bernardetia TaxID=2647129 RepID=UPI0030D15506
MKLKLFILFLLVFGAIGQTIFLNIDAKSNFLWESSEKSKNSYTQISDNEIDESSIQPSEVVVTIRHHDSEIINQNVNMELQNNNANFNEEGVETTSSTKPTTKKTCDQENKKERLICQKAKDAAKNKQNRVSGSNHTKSSTIQNP